MVGVMMLMNLLVTPYYMTGGSVGAVVELIPTLLLPFNLAKALLNSAFAMILYKPVVVAMRRAKLLEGNAKITVNRASVSVWLCAAATLACSIVIFVILKK
jgi:hypothetical protein